MPFLTVNFLPEKNLTKIQTTKREIQVYNLEPYTMCYFTVRADIKSTAIVSNNSYTDLINVSTTNENPIPRLLVGTSDNIEIWDMDLKKSSNLLSYPAKKIVYSLAGNTIFWFDYDDNLMTSDINGNNPTTIHRLKNYGFNLRIDWVKGYLYWLEWKHYQITRMQLDLTKWQYKYNESDYIKINNKLIIGAIIAMRYVNIDLFDKRVQFCLFC